MPKILQPEELFYGDYVPVSGCPQFSYIMGQYAYLHVGTTLGIAA